MICQENEVNSPLVMLRSLARYRAIIALLTAAMWAFGAIAGPAHAAEEDIHHAMQHQDDKNSTAVSDDAAPQDERSVHPEHATQCHSGVCHFHAMSRGALDATSDLIFAAKLVIPYNDFIQQATYSSLFRPPRI